MFIVWWIGFLFVTGIIGDNLHDSDDGVVKKHVNLFVVLATWPLILGRMITVYIDQWERYSVFRATGIDRNKPTAKESK